MEMTTRRYLVTGGAGVNLRTCPSSSYPTATPVQNVPKGEKLDVITDWTAVNTVGSETTYLPVLMDGKVYYCTKALVQPYDAGAYVLETAQSMGNDMVKNGYHYRTNGETMAATFAASKTSGKKGCTCTRYVSWVLQQAGHLKSGKLIGHDLSGKEYLVDCMVIPSGKKCTDLVKNKIIQPGDVLVSALKTAGGNMCCIFASYDGPTWYEAGGPFHGLNCAKSSNDYIKIGPMKVGYNATHPKVEYIIRPL